MKKSESHSWILYIIFVIAALFLGPLFTFWLAYLGGWFAKIVIGKSLALALNTLLNVSYFTPDKIPLISGAIGWISGFFYTVKNVGQN